MKRLGAIPVSRSIRKDLFPENPSFITEDYIV
jgi:hypothetical protein